MGVNNVSKSPAISHTNETEENVNRWNVNLPPYLYREIPAVFEIIGVMLNIAIIVYFIKSRKYKKPTFTILTFLAAMDACVCLGAMMIILLLSEVVTPETGFLCALAWLVLVTGLLGSEYTLVFFAVVRLYQVMSPLKARASITMSLLMKCCATIIMGSFGLSLLHAVFWRSVNTVINDEVTTMCIFIADRYSKDLAIVIVLTAIPCFAIFLIHVLKYFAYVRSRGLLSNKREQKSPDAHVVAIMLILLYLCWIPATTYNIIQHLRIADYEPIEDSVLAVLSHVAYANSIINPLVYVLAMKSIRDDVIKLFCFARQ